MKRIVASFLLVAAACGGSGDRVVVGAGTTLVDGGFIDLVVADYEAATGARVSVVGESSQRLLDLARRGEASVLLTHEADALEAFLDDGLATNSTPVFRSQFFLAGPPEVGIAANTFEGAFAEIAEASHLFVGRADGSGTFLAERNIWWLAGIDPEGRPWYETTGQGMGLTLQVASQRGGFVLVEEGTWRTISADLNLTLVPIGDSWPNPYFATLVDGADGAARDFYEWLSGPDGAAAVAEANRQLFGDEVYRTYSPSP